jgi:hypothetical protein
MKQRAVIPMLRFNPDSPRGSTRIEWDEALQLAEHDAWVVTPDVVGGMPERA